MTKGRDNAAESLSEVVDFIRVRQQSGLLNVERSQGGRIEEGEIYLQAGQPIYAYTELLLGQEALNVLLSWRQVHFAFLPDAPRPAPNLSLGGALSGRRTMGGSVGGLPGVPLASLTYPQMNGDVPMASDRVNDDAHGYVGISSRTNTYKPGLEWLIPQRVNSDLDVLSLSLTRRQRSIYLLVDGRRTISDLSRCTGKSLQEVERILIELQERGLLVL